MIILIINEILLILMWIKCNIILMCDNESNIM